MAFRRTVSVLKMSHMDKHWAKYHPVEGRVIQHLSPYEQNIMQSLFKNAHKKVLAKAIKWMLEAGPGIALTVGLYTWGNYEYKKTHFEHRP
mmetsp:Transcript_14501/g.31529  ORF Transcript_14501/g.31529 Transcript_14501/m.31529 type:complete len:91 (+) Transcript_14501:41-313(+)|eukprot:CAMPEP_0116956768 /NCGR_PEP_ID=MMETSP0467-20121206/43540_1 /TAXON_ID=283647 /ORGANISM="Mesodinium pulex, Strain SPMC105" /LENGTH=90 /DNA_ID=CAMNT_0004643325 /DNA_START=37 /DNA_END=309 /DNA_ORIENTATION=-